MDTNKEERRTSLIVRELKHYKTDIAALSETCLAGEGKITDIGAVCTNIHLQHSFVIFVVVLSGRAANEC